jgi:hypothetical protein
VDRPRCSWGSQQQNVGAPVLRYCGDAFQVVSIEGKGTGLHFADAKLAAPNESEINVSKRGSCPAFEHILGRQEQEHVTSEMFQFNQRQQHR